MQSKGVLYAQYWVSCTDCWASKEIGGDQPETSLQASGWQKHGRGWCCIEHSNISDEEALANTHRENLEWPAQLVTVLGEYLEQACEDKVEEVVAQLRILVDSHTTREPDTLHLVVTDPYLRSRIESGSLKTLSMGCMSDFGARRHHVDVSVDSSLTASESIWMDGKVHNLAITDTPVMPYLVITPESPLEIEALRTLVYDAQIQEHERSNEWAEKLFEFKQWAKDN